MKRWQIAGLLALVLTTGVVIGAISPATSQAPPQRTTLTFFDARATDFEKNLPVPPKGFGPGDGFIQKDTWFDPETCEKAGTFLLQGRVVKRIGKNDAFVIFHGGARLPDGGITIYAPARFADFDSGPFAAVTGGYGAYRDATGDLDVTEDSTCGDMKGDLITIDLAL